jgi:hypothetical protein
MVISGGASDEERFLVDSEELEITIHCLANATADSINSGCM